MNWLARVLNTGYVGALAYVERGVPFWPVEAIEALQRRRIRAIVVHAYNTVPFYRSAMDERRLRPRDIRTAEDLARLPLIDKTIVNENRDLFVSRRYRDRIALTFVSGSGKIVHWDERSSLRQLAYAERDRVVLGKLVGRLWGQRQLYLLPSSSSSLDERRWWNEHTWSPRRIADRHFVSTALPYECVIDSINTIQPQVVFSYGSYTEHFFRFLTDRRLSIAPPRVWMYGGDMLSAEGRELVEKTCGCHVFSSYQSVETGRHGFMCERCEGFHLNVDWCPVRLVDEQGQTSPAGERGEVVVCNLENRAMVLLNYRLGDMGVMAAGPCSCGRTLPVLERLEGRCSEAIRLTDGRVIPSLVLQSFCRAELGPTLQNQVVLHGPGRITWQIVASSLADRDEMRRAVLDKAHSLLGADMRIELEFVDHIPSTPRGKFHIAISEPGGR